jgi:hypothetical protein
VNAIGKLVDILACSASQAAAEMVKRPRQRFLDDPSAATERPDLHGAVRVALFRRLGLIVGDSSDVATVMLGVASCRFRVSLRRVLHYVVLRATWLSTIPRFESGGRLFFANYLDILGVSSIKPAAISSTSEFPALSKISAAHGASRVARST